MRRREQLCPPCPFNPFRTGGAVPADVRDTVADRIADGERWICHATCSGAVPLPGSMLCAGAPAPGTAAAAVRQALS